MLHIGTKDIETKRVISHKGIGNQIIGIPSMYGKSGGYIEVQVWNDSYIKEILKYLPRNTQK